MAVKQASKVAGITKEVCAYASATLLLHICSKTDSILSHENLLGHENIETTMDYLHIAQLDTIKAFSPLDTLFAKWHEVAHVLIN
jgi:site-specific recombinase XerD